MNARLLLRLRCRVRCLGLALALVFGVFHTMTAAATLPASPSPSYIHDEAKWLSPDSYSGLNAKLKTFEEESSSQIVVAIFSSLPPGEEMVDYTHRIFEHWKIGRADKDNGVLFAIFAGDRLMRIHTGYGLEGALPDALCKQILQDIVAPLLRLDQRDAAVIEGTSAIIDAARGEYTGDARTYLQSHQETINDQEQGIVIIVVLFLLFITFYRMFSSSDTIYTDRGRRNPSHWPGGGWGGSSSGGGWSSGGGGFSGGGGSSGGGGASGSW
jgi:uncharacterized protein